MADFFSFYNRLNEQKRLDPVDDTEVDRKFKNRKDKDIDNDGDVDSSDEYLHKRRKAIDKEMEKDSGKSSKKKQKQMVVDELEKDEDDPCWDGYVQVGTKMKNGKEVPKCVPMEEAKNYMKEEVSKLLGEAKERGYIAFHVKKGKTEVYANTSYEAAKKAAKKWKLKSTSGIDVKLAESKTRNVNEAYDYPDYGPTGAAEMAMTQLHFIQYAAEEVIECLKAGTEMPEWYQNKIAKVEGDMEGIHSYMEGKRRKREMCGPEDMGIDDYGYDMDMDMDTDADMDMDMDMDDEDMMGTGMFESKQISEKLSATDDISDWIKDFKDSDAEQFKGKSDEERKDMAIAAYYDARREAGYKTPQQKDD